MREIEVKAKLRDKAGFLKAAAKLGMEFGDAITQADTTYESNLPYNDPNWNIFRIRRQGAKILLTMKHRASSRSRDNHEYETDVGDPKEIEKMLARVGYLPDVRITKKRRVAHYKGLELCLDDVERLGMFVEVEKLAADDADVDAVQHELWELLLQLGIDPLDRVHKGYDTLMRALGSDNA
jgi:adenylate cyclase, class 2